MYYFTVFLYAPNGKQIACREGCARGLSVASEKVEIPTGHVSP